MKRVMVSLICRECEKTFEVIFWKRKKQKFCSRECVNKYWRELEFGEIENGRIKHGMLESRTYQTWRQMKNRCTYIWASSYKDYGGRGIKVSKSWQSFKNFYKDMGIRPDGKTLDRINNNGDYSKTNCRWATMKEQSNNKRNNRKITHNGETLNVSQWAEKLSIPASRLFSRLNGGKLTIAEALKNESQKNREIFG